MLSSRIISKRPQIFLTRARRWAKSLLSSFIPSIFPSSFQELVGQDTLVPLDHSFPRNQYTRHSRSITPISRRTLFCHGWLDTRLPRTADASIPRCLCPIKENLKSCSLSSTLFWPYARQWRKSQNSIRYSGCIPSVLAFSSESAYLFTQFP